MRSIKDYADIVGKETIEEIEELGSYLNGKIVQNINSTPVGGGVAEILSRMVPLLKEVGVDAKRGKNKQNENKISGKT